MKPLSIRLDLKDCNQLLAALDSRLAMLASMDDGGLGYVRAAYDTTRKLRDLVHAIFMIGTDEEQDAVRSDWTEPELREAYGR